MRDLKDETLTLRGLSAAELSQVPSDTSRLLSISRSPLQSDLHSSTATGFTLQEIKALGNFPDYATLSGVPLPRAYHEFDVSKAIPRPYRPIRWAYHQTMGATIPVPYQNQRTDKFAALAKMEPDWWLELESTYVTRIQQRKDLYAQHGKNVLQALPGSELATKELMEMCLQFLCARYPHYFSLDDTKTVFRNGILGTDTNLKSTPPLHVLLENVPEDFAIVLRDPETGLYTFRAGVICSSLGWSLGTKIGKTLAEIHEPIPDYKEKMQFSMDRYESIL